MQKALLLENVHPISAQTLRDAGFEVETRSGALDEADLIEALAGVSVLGIRSKTQITRAVFAACPQLVAVGVHAIGTNQVDLVAANSFGVAVFNAPYANTRSVVELALAEIISLTRRLVDHDRSLHQGIWDKTADGAHEVRGRTLGIIGYGSIGSQLSILAEALGMRVLFYDLEEKLALGNAKRHTNLHDLLSESDAVSVHIDGRPSNRGFIDETKFAAMKPGAVFLNLSRGFVIDIEALKAALEAEHLSGAAVDVFPDEPKKRGEPFASPLQGMSNVILSPHVGGSTEEAQELIGEFVAAKLRDYVATGSTMLSVNLPNLQLGPKPTTGRIMLLHRNVPGVLATVNRIFADHGANIEAQLLATEGDIGYVVTDISQVTKRGCSKQLLAMDAAIRLRIRDSDDRDEFPLAKGAGQ